MGILDDIEAENDFIDEEAEFTDDLLNVEAWDC